MIMVDFKNLICNKTMDVNNNVKMSNNTCGTGTSYKQVMENIMKQKENVHTSENREFSKIDDANVKKKYKAREAEQRPTDEVKTKNETEDVREVKEKKKVKESQKDTSEKEDVKSDDNILDMIENILEMLSTMLNLDTNQKETAKNILYNELSQINFSGLDNSNIISKIANVVEGIQIGDMPGFEEVINKIKNMIIDEAVTISEVEENITTDLNLDKLSQDGDNTTNELISTDGSSSNVTMKSVSELKTVEAQINHVEAEDKPMDVDVEANEEIDLTETPDDDSDMKVKDNGSNYPETKDDININADESVINYATIDEKSIGIHNNERIVNRNPLMERTKIIDREEIIKQIVESSQLIDSDDVTELRIRLKPDYLGRVTVRLIMENGEMTAKFIAENQSVKETIESSFTELKEYLNQKGINIQSLSVSVGNQEKWQKEKDGFNSWKSSNKRISFIEDPVAELVDGISTYDNPYDVKDGLLDIRV